MVIAPLVEARLASAGSAQTSETSSNRPAETYGPMRFAAYQFTTSGALALSELRICVFHASRSTTVRFTVRFGCISSNFAARPSITARGAGLDMSDVMFNSPVRSAANAVPANAVEAASVATDALIMERMVSSLDAFLCQTGRRFPCCPILRSSRCKFHYLKLGFGY